MPKANGATSNSILLVALVCLALAMGCSTSRTAECPSPEDHDENGDIFAFGMEDDPSDPIDDDDDVEPNGVTGRFNPEQTGGFYSLPFPCDLRLTAKGTLKVDDFPNPRNALLLKSYLELGQSDVRGFGANSGIFFAFTGPIDPTSLPADVEASTKMDASVFLVGIDSAAQDYGRRYPVRWKYTQTKTVYGPENLLVILPLQGVPLAHGQTYAVVMTTDVLDTQGSAIAAPKAFQDVLSGESIHEQAVEVFAPLVEFLISEGIDPADVALATVFTTQDPLPRMLALRDHVYQANLPGIDTATLTIEKQYETYTFIKGSIVIPIYQEGVIPYLFEGGAIRFDSAGKPIVQSESEIRFSLTIPKSDLPENGWPLLVYSHGSGGSWKSMINKGVTDWLARKGIAAVSIDAPHHGPRNPFENAEDLEAFFFYNALNPYAFRDNNVQAAVELMAVLRQVLDLTVPPEVLPVPEKNNAEAPGHHFDEQNVFFMGHSQGSTVGPLLVAVDPKVRAAYFSGAGASLLWNMLTKQRPFPINPLIRIGLHLSGDEADDELDEFHPVLNLIQHMAEMVDPMGFNPYFFEKPVPGAGPKHVLQAQGVTDTYVGQPCHGAFAAAARMDLIMPIVNEDAWQRLMWTGGQILPDEGIVGNRVDYSGAPTTSALVQYPEPPNGDDGHYVTFRFPSMHRRVACFFKTALDDAVPLIVDDSGDETGSCEITSP